MAGLLPPRPHIGPVFEADFAAAVALQLQILLDALPLLPALLLNGPLRLLHLGDELLDALIAGADRFGELFDLLSLLQKFGVELLDQVQAFAVEPPIVHSVQMAEAQCGWDPWGGWSTWGRLYHPHAALTPRCSCTPPMQLYHPHAALPPPCSSTTPMQLYPPHAALPPPCSSTTPMQLYHPHAALPPPCSSTPPMQLYHPHAALPPPCSSTTPMQLYHPHAALPPPCSSTTPMQLYPPPPRPCTRNTSARRFPHTPEGTYPK